MRPVHAVVLAKILNVMLILDDCVRYVGISSDITGFSLLAREDTRQPNSTSHRHVYAAPYLCGIHVLQKHQASLMQLEWKGAYNSQNEHFV